MCSHLLSEKAICSSCVVLKVGDFEEWSKS